MKDIPLESEWKEVEESDIIKILIGRRIINAKLTQEGTFVFQLDNGYEFEFESEPISYEEEVVVAKVREIKS